MNKTRGVFCCLTLCKYCLLHFGVSVFCVKFWTPKGGHDTKEFASWREPCCVDPGYCVSLGKLKATSLAKDATSVPRKAYREDDTNAFQEQDNPLCKSKNNLSVVNTTP